MSSHAGGLLPSVVGRTERGGACAPSGGRRRAGRRGSRRESRAAPWRTDTADEGVRRAVGRAVAPMRRPRRRRWHERLARHPGGQHVDHDSALVRPVVVAPPRVRRRRHHAATRLRPAEAVRKRLRRPENSVVPMHRLKHAQSRGGAPRVSTRARRASRANARRPAARNDVVVRLADELRARPRRRRALEPEEERGERSGFAFARPARRRARRRGAFWPRLASLKRAAAAHHKFRQMSPAGRRIQVLRGLAQRVRRLVGKYAEDGEMRRW